MNPTVYQMARRPTPITVTRRTDFAKPAAVEVVPIVTVDRATECHVTPPEVAARLVDYLGSPGNGATLEPSAGTGNISRALLAAGYTDIVQVERHNSLAAGLDTFGVVVNRCFLEYAADTAARFDRIAMNPPFSGVRQHMRAAVALLAPGGRLVALVPVTFDAAGFETVEQLPDDTFSTARVRTKIVEYFN